MGGSSYSDSDFVARASMRSSTAKAKDIDYTSAVFAHDYAIRTGAAARAVHATLSPKGAIRECRDSAAHPVSVPIGIMLDMTGSMGDVPPMIQKELSKLMGCFLNDKASGKKYLGDGYPAIIISAVDDYVRGCREGCLQVGQFESGIEIDDNLSNLWFTRNGGGGEPEESYGLGMWFFGNRTVHDHWEKRGRKGYLFIIGDEKTYPTVSKQEIDQICGVPVQDDFAIAEVVAKLKERYHVFFITPNLTTHYKQSFLRSFWTKYLGENVIDLEDPNKICETIVSCVAICEGGVTVDDLSADIGVDGAASMALVALSKDAGRGAVAKHAVDNLPAVAVGSGGNERL